MELNVKAIAGGITLFVLGGFSVYLVSSSTEERARPAAETVVQYQAPAASTPPMEPPSITDAESFYEAAEARREQQLVDKAEADQLAKLKAIKERSVECKFWKQQQKTSSAAAKIDEKIDEHCNLPSSTAASEDSTSSESGSSSNAVAASSTSSL